MPQERELLGGRGGKGSTLLEVNGREDGVKMAKICHMQYKTVRKKSLKISY